MSTITEKQYLDMRGFSSLEWEVCLKEESNHYLEMSGAINNMYPVKEKPAIKAFGKSAYIIKTEWKNKYEVPTVEEKAEKTKAPSVPSVPSVPKKETPVAPKATEEVVKEIPEFVKARIGKLIALHWANDKIKKSLLSPHGEFLTYKELEDMGNKEWDKYILVPKKEEEPQPDIPAKEMVGFNCDKFENTGEACNEQCYHCKEQDKPKEEVESPIQNRIDKLISMGYELVEGWYRKEIGVDLLSISDKDVKSLNATDFVEELKVLEAEEKNHLKAMEEETKAEAIAETSGEMSDEEAEKLGEETRKELIASGSIEDDSDTVIELVKGSSEETPKGSITKDPIDDIVAEATKPIKENVDKAFEEKRKKAKTSKTADEVKISKPDKPEINKDKVVGRIGMLEEVKGAIDEYIYLSFTHSKIKEVLESDLTPSKKIKEIESLMND